MAANAGITTEGPLTLHFQNITRVAGETLQGRVDLNMQLAQEDNLEQIRVKFRGTVNTKITVQSGKTTIDYRSWIVLFATKFPIWNRGTYPEPSSNGIVSVPFAFQLPAELPPSFHCEAYRRQATVSYSLEVVGARSGLFRFNRRLRRVISVVPAATPNQVLVRQMLSPIWNGGWKTFSDQEKLRRGIWGDYAHARARLTMPDLPAFPIGTPIPFSLYIETDTKPLNDQNPAGPVNKDGEQLFPVPPAVSSEVRFQLHRWAEVCARKRVRTVEDDYKLQGGLGDPKCVAAVRHVKSEPEWIPDPKDKKGRGIWRRSIQFESAVTLLYAPTYKTEIVRWEYQLRFTIPFPGIGNDLVLKVPIHLFSGSACPPLPPPPGASGSGITYKNAPPEFPRPSMLDLPPAYWSGDNHDWDADEKS